MKKLMMLMSVCVGSTMSLSGCCDDVCDAADDLRANVAHGYANCCQTEDDDAGWGACVQQANERNFRMRETLLAAQAACENGQDDLMEELLRDFYELLRGRVVEAIGPTQLRSGNQIANTYMILEPSDQISVAMSAIRTSSSVQNTQPVVVNGEIYTAEAGGVAVEAQTMLADPGAEVLATALPVQSLIVENYQFEQGGTMTVLAGPFERTLRVVKGRLSTIELVMGDQRKVVPSDFVLTLQGDGIQATLTLEATCPYNHLTIDENGVGFLGVGVSLASESTALNRVSQLGAFWMRLPVVRDASGALSFATSGWAVGTDVFPVQPETMSIALGQTGNSIPLPSGREESCADSDGNGIRDGADEIINIYDNLGGCN